MPCISFNYLKHEAVKVEQMQSNTDLNWKDNQTYPQTHRPAITYKIERHVWLDKPGRTAQVILIISLLLFALSRTAQNANARALFNAVVGSGTPQSCTETAFDDALTDLQAAQGGQITFDCGGPATITFTDQKIVPGSTTIDGAGQITLSGGNKTRLFFVNSGLTLNLQGLTLRDGAADVGGGLIEIFGGALSISGSTLRDSTAVTDGGAINCSTDNGGSINLSDTTLSGNTAVKGGAIYSGGCALNFQDSEFSANKTTGISRRDQLGRRRLPRRPGSAAGPECRLGRQRGPGRRRTFPEQPRHCSDQRWRFHK